MNYKKIVIVIVSVAVFSVLLYFLLLWTSYEFDASFLKHDSCLDDGGRWNKATQVCELS